MAVAAPPQLLSQPTSQTASRGATVQFGFKVQAAGDPSYQWFKDAQPLAGATSPVLTLREIKPDDTGAYTVRVTDRNGDVTSTPAILTVARPPRLINASVRSHAGLGDDTLIAGFVIRNGDKPVLIRGIGPSLATFNVPGILAHPRIELHDMQTQQIRASNAGWFAGGDAAAITDDDARLGAFALAQSSSDAALRYTLPSGAYTVNLSDVGGATGVAMIEIYDSNDAVSGKLINLSARTKVGTGADTLILGFVIVGEGTEKLLLRGIGPTLASFGVTGALPQPQLQLRNAQGSIIADNASWGADPAIGAAAADVGAFRLSPDSNDSSLLLQLPAGVYTAQVSGTGQTTGVAMAELYEVPQTLPKIPQPETRWTMINVSPNSQQADCHLIEFPNGQKILIDIADAGDAAGTAMAYLRAHQITKLDLVVLSHFHLDHYGRLIDLIQSGIKIGRVALNMPAPDATLTDAEYPWGFIRSYAQSHLQFLTDNKIPYFTPQIGETLIEVPLPGGTFASLTAVCLYDGSHTPIGKTDTNDTSIILRLTHGTARALFTGDLNRPLGTWLATSGYDLAADILKAPHHGTDGCAPNEFFARVNPTAVLVPSPQSLWNSDRSSRTRNYFGARKIPAYVNGFKGHVTVTMNAAGYTIQCEHPDW